MTSATLGGGYVLESGGWRVAPSLALGYERLLSDAPVDSQAVLLGLPVEQQSARDTRNLYRAGLDLDLSRGAWTLSASLEGAKGGDSSGGGALLEVGYTF
ncbi:hypothetical protein D9M68_557200 [compost metagenome]